MLFDNYKGELTPNVRSRNTFESVEVPCLIFWHYDASTTKESVLLRYFVGPRKDTTYPKIDKTYTVNVEYNGNIFTRTTYKGHFEIEVSGLVLGESYMDVQAVDSDGVESPVHHLPIYRKADTTPVTYNMKEGDLATFGIVCGEITDVSTAIQNKIGISAFLKWCSDNGYNHVTMLNRLYMIDYHKKDDLTQSGDNIVFQSHMTVDLNGSTIKVIPADNLNSGIVLSMGNLVDSHIMNGKIVGQFKDTDFDKIVENTGKTGIPAEGLSTFHARGCRFCSVENMDISGSVGYDCSISNNGTLFYPGSNVASFSDSNIGCIGYNGEIVDVQSMRYCDYKPINGAKRIKFGIYLALGGFFGDDRTMFISFYDASKNFIQTVKTQMYYYVGVPDGAYYARASCYGDEDSLTRNYSSGGSVLPRFAEYNDSIGFEMKNCYLHDTRTCTLTNPFGQHISFINIVFTNIAAVEDKWRVTRRLTDFEDNWQNHNYIFMENCRCEICGSNSMAIKYAFNFVMHNCSGIEVEMSQGVDKCMFLNNQFTNIKLGIVTKNPYHQTVWYGNKIDNFECHVDSNAKDPNVDMWNCDVESSYSGLRKWTV